MAKKKHKTKYHDYYASSEVNDTFGTIFDSMARSLTFQSLSIGARYFYVLCRVQAQSKHGKQCLYQHTLEDGTEYLPNSFVFPAKHIEFYGLKRSNAHRYFVELITAGFIEVSERNQHRKKVNVYQFSDKWKQNIVYPSDNKVLSHK